MKPRYRHCSEPTENKKVGSAVEGSPGNSKEYYPGESISLKPDLLRAMHGGLFFWDLYFGPKWPAVVVFFVLLWPRWSVKLGDFGPLALGHLELELPIILGDLQPRACSLDHLASKSF